MAAKEPLRLDKEKVLLNAITSIQLGVEDYQMSTAQGGNPLRAISAARNLFAGVLLLFKYKLASLATTPEHAAALIYKPAKFKPCLGEKGQIEWHPELERSNTIDVGGLQRYFDGLGIKTDWVVVSGLQKCRNELEHLHPNHPIESIKKFLVELFPLLRDFIEDELNENPAVLLEQAWEVMLKNHEFFTQNQERAHAAWRAIGVQSHTLEFFSNCQCPNCGSLLLQPNSADVDEGFSFTDSEFRYMCIACGQTDSFTDLLTEDLMLWKEDPFSEVQVVVECDECWHIAFDQEEGCCLLCGSTRTVRRCDQCQAYLKNYEAENGCLCDRCMDEAHHDEYQRHFR